MPQSLPSLPKKMHCSSFSRNRIQVEDSSKLLEVVVVVVVVVVPSICDAYCCTNSDGVNCTCCDAFCISSGDM